MRQPRGADSRPLPVFYFSELSGLAFGSSNVKQWMDKLKSSDCISSIEAICKTEA
jgi:heterodisulfide reductase subunit B